MKKRSGCVKNEKDLSSEDLSILVQHRTPKLDKKIEKMKAMMGSTVQKVPAAKPSAGKFVDYKGVNKLPMQGGACTPK